MWILNLSKPRAVVKEFEVEPLDGDPYGRLKSGHMKLSSYWIHSSHWEGDIGSLFHINGYGEHSRSYIRGSYLQREIPGDEEVICTFDQPPPDSQDTREALRGVSFLQIGYWSGWQNRTSRMVLFALMLKHAKAKPEGTFVRVGIAEFPFPKHARFDRGHGFAPPPTPAEVDAMYKAFEDDFDKVSTEQCPYRDPEGFEMDSWEMTDVIIV
ncbi:uncharacterized protein DNG_04706 [Cephalotrichum gorgonifer]|uniref:Uncharacterized protein n=1 Tax=Cephalotrichum gorgonifer TaxID=2041049 RepID=A0AAE8MZ03_9PEZI|nr:uncharacterized protein DNG_04706 [Cephalotrichum gorgonifer]